MFSTVANGAYLLRLHMKDCLLGLFTFVTMKEFGKVGPLQMSHLPLAHGSKQVLHN